MSLVDRLRQQASFLENENYHTAASTMREAADALEEANRLLMEARRLLTKGSES